MISSCTRIDEQPFFPARDPKLNRHVAFTVLPESVAADTDRLSASSVKPKRWRRYDQGRTLDA
jgi:hypothetical protein